MSAVMSAPTPVAGAARVALGGATIQVPYSKLFLSKDNVRSKKTRTPESVRALAEMIAAEGQLNELQVTRELRDGKPTGRFGVVAGGRRWMAIGQLVTQKRLSGDPLVNCKEVAPGHATGVSLAENIGSLRMHPADEFAAFAKLIAEGKSESEVAKHFGVTVLEVQRRMKLASVAPALVEKYREGELDLEQMMALASVDDHKRQLAVWKSLPEYQRSAGNIRRRLTEDEVAEDDPRVKLIGLERYRASGGSVRQDLFTEKVFLEAGLVDLIMAEVLSDAVDRVQREGWAWVEVFESMGYAERERFTKPPTKYLPESDKDRVEREKLEAQLDKAEDEYNELADADGDVASENESDALDDTISSIRAKLDALREKRVDTSGFDKATLGAVVTIESGVLKIMRGLMTAKEAKVETKRQQAVRIGTDPTKAVESAEYSEALTLDLTSHRTAAVQASLATNVPVALAMLADSLCTQVFLGSGEGSSVQIRVVRCAGQLEANTTGLQESKAGQRLAVQRERWDAMLPAPKDRLGWLLTQPQGIVLELIAFCTAVSVDMISRRVSPAGSMHAIAGALGLDMSEWWQAGAENFLSRVPKAKIVSIVTEVRGVEAAAPLAAMKKGDASAKAAELLADSRWLPTPLRVGAAERVADVAAGHAQSAAAVGHALSVASESADREVQAA